MFNTTMSARTTTPNGHVLEVSTRKRLPPKYISGDSFSRGYWDKGDGDKTTVYIWPEGESVLDNFFNRHSRPYNFYKKEIVPTLRELLRLPANVKFSWSQNAGCTCGCSPGFLLKLEDSWLDWRGKRKTRQVNHRNRNFGTVDVTLKLSESEFPFEAKSFTVDNVDDKLTVINVEV